MPTKDLTYTVTGKFDNSKLELGALLPQLINDGYTFEEIHDISKKSGPQYTNALLIYMKTDSGDNRVLTWNGTDPAVNLPVITQSSFIVHPLSPGFDWKANDTLVILFHEPPSTQDINDMQDEVKNLYLSVLEQGSFNTTWGGHSDKDEKAGTPPFVPRKAGMTIISKP